MSNTLIFAVMALAFGIYVLYSRKKYNKARTAAFEGLAADMGLRFYPERLDMLDRFRGMHLMKMGDGRIARNIIFGYVGDVRISIFDFHYSVGSARYRIRKMLTAVALESAEITAPVFSMWPLDAPLVKLRKVFGGQDINFESHPEFSKLFVLEGPKEKPLRDFFTPERLTFFETKAGYCVEVNARQIVVYKIGELIRPENVEDLLASAQEIYGRIVDG